MYIINCEKHMLFYHFYNSGIAGNTKNDNFSYEPKTFGAIVFQISIFVNNTGCAEIYLHIYN